MRILHRFGFGFVILLSSSAALVEGTACASHDDCATENGICDAGMCKPCDNGSTRQIQDGQGFCYFSARVDFNTALQSCEGIGLQLVEIENPAKFAAVDALGGYDYTWLGLVCGASNVVCDADFAAWSWLSDGASYDGLGMHLDGDGTILGGSEGERCGAWWGDQAKIGPQFCEDTFYGALCESVATSSDRTQCCDSYDDCAEANSICIKGQCKPCDNGSTRQIQNGYEFCYFPQRVDFATAKGSCEGLGLQLAEIRDAEKFSAVDALGSYDYTWLGLTCVASNLLCDTDFASWTWLSDDASYDGLGMQLDGDGTILGGSEGELCGAWWDGQAKMGPQFCDDVRFYGALCEEPSKKKSNKKKNRGESVRRNLAPKGQSAGKKCKKGRGNVD